MEFKQTEEQKKRQYKRKPQPAAEVVNEFGKLQPQNLELEDAVLGALMLEKDAYSKVVDILKPDCFYNPENQKIYEAIQTLGSMSQPIDMLTVTEQLRVLGTLDEVGGPVRISRLTASVSSAANIEFHARIVAQKYLARELISFSSQIQSLAFDDSIDILDVLHEAEGKLFELSQSNLKKDVTRIDPVILDALKKLEEAGNRQDGLSGLATGFDEIDRMTSGWQPSDLV
ncbi:MAG: replicative DNA helicase, partial [Muribaculaceae bacterium]